MTDDIEFYNSFGRLSGFLNSILKRFPIPSTFISYIFTYLWEHKDLTIELDRGAKAIWQKN